MNFAPGKKEYSLVSNVRPTPLSTQCLKVIHTIKYLENKNVFLQRNTVFTGIVKDLDEPVTTIRY